MDGAVAGPSSWRTGEVIDGRYEVLAVLGNGGMGVLHRVRHREWGIDLADTVASSRACCDVLITSELLVWIDP